MLGCVVDAVAYKAVEVGAGGDARGCRVPELVVMADVLRLENNPPCAVHNDEEVVGIAIVLYQPANNETVVKAVTVGGDNVGELQQAVAVVALPIDEKVVEDEAVAAGLVDEVEGHVVDGVGEKAVEESPGELAFDNGIKYGGVAAGLDVDEIGDGAVLSLAARQGDAEDGVGVDRHAVERIGQLVGTDIGVGSVEQVVENGEVVVKQRVAVGRDALYKEGVEARGVHGVAIENPRQPVLHHGIKTRQGVVGPQGKGIVAQGVASKGQYTLCVAARLGEGESVPDIRHLVAADGTADRVENQTAAVGAGEQDAVGGCTASGHLYAAEAVGARGVVIRRGRFVEAEDCPSSRGGIHIEIKCRIHKTISPYPSYRMGQSKVQIIDKRCVAQRYGTFSAEETRHRVVNIDRKIQHRERVERVVILR